MTKVTYEIVEHNGGWAYRMDGVFSETFPSHDARARRPSARRESTSGARRIHRHPLRRQGRWHEGEAVGDDRPETEVKG